MKQIIFLAGVSGVGKSTLLNYIKAWYPECDIQTIEASARPYLPEGGSYDQTLTDEIQAVIVQSRTLSVMEFLLEPKGPPIGVFTRSALDNLAYQRVLKKGLFLNKSNEREVEMLAKNDNVIFIYIPIEFPLDPSDEKRGVNEEVREATDKAMVDIIGELNIPHFLVKGTKEQRFKSMDVILAKYGLEKFPF